MKNLSLYELKLLIEALQKAANRLESEHRFYSRNGSAEKAADMRKLKALLEKLAV